jgi:peroxiredoxin Q/BCP
LLADPGHKLVDASGVEMESFKDFKFASRKTHFIAPLARIVNFWPRVDQDLGHYRADVLAEIAAAKK